MPVWKHVDYIDSILSNINNLSFKVASENEWTEEFYVTYLCESYKEKPFV